MKQGDNYYGPLTGLRAIAAGLVLLFHYFEAARVFNGTSLPWVSWLLGNGQNGVTIFFTLSGFLLTIRYRDALRSGTVSTGGYLLRRLVRIYPAYLVAAFVLSVWPQLVFDGSTAYSAPWTWLGLALMGQAFFLSLFPLGLPIGWTLTVEAIFYVVAPTLMTRLRGSLLRVLLLATACCAVLAAVLVAVVRWPELYAFSGYNESFIFLVSFFARGPEFVVGVAAGVLFLDLRARISPQLARGLIYGGLLVALVFLQLANHFSLERVLVEQALARFVGAAAVAVFLLGVTSHPALTTVGRFLSTPVMDYLGATSYALYLVHLTWPLQQVWAALLTLPVHPLILVPLTYAASVAASILLYEGVEKPVQRLLRKRVD